MKSGELGNQILPMIPQFVPAITNAFKQHQTATEENKSALTLLQLSVVTALYEIVNKIGQFLTPYLVDILECCLSPRIQFNSSAPPQEQQVFFLFPKKKNKKQKNPNN